MAQRAVLWSGVVLAGALLCASAPWSRVLPACSEVPAAQREQARLAGRCEGRAPIVNVAPGAARKGELRGARSPVPDLRGRPFNRGDERLARFIVMVDYRESAQRRDWVLDQVPRPPASLPDGGGLRVVLSDGALVRVPDVRGTFARALVLLHRAGLGWSTSDGSAGRVVGQTPAAGSAVRPGTQVLLKVAAGAAPNGPLALAPESTRPQVAAPPAPTAPPPTVPAPPPATVPAPTSPTPATGAAPPPNPGAAPGAAPLPNTAPASATMPDVQGMIFDAARERLAGFSVQRVHRGGTEPGGTVIGQTPAAGTPIAAGTTVRLVLSDGSLVRVPRVMSFTLTEARQRLAAGELRPVVTNVAGDAPSGTVVRQQPAEGQIAQRGSTIRLTVSSGPAARAALAVPNVVGSLLDRARPQLERFRIERTERAAREPVGTILEQSPPPGTAVEPGGTVSIIVSSGGRPEVIEVANVAGQSADAAGNALSEFRVEREAVPSVEPAGRVLAQEPAPGSALAPGSTVRLRVSDGSRVRAPTVAQMTLAQARDAARAAGLEVALAEGRDDPAARVARQVPAPGTEVARGSALQVVVEDRLLAWPMSMSFPSDMRDAWTRVSGGVMQVPSRTLAIVAVVLLALLALLVVGRRRRRERYVFVEPVLSPAHPVTVPVRAPPAPAPVPPAEPSAAEAKEPHRAVVEPSRPPVSAPATKRPESPTAARPPKPVPAVATASPAPANHRPRPSAATTNEPPSAPATKPIPAALVRAPAAAAPVPEPARAPLGAVSTPKEPRPRAMPEPIVPTSAVEPPPGAMGRVPAALTSPRATPETIAPAPVAEPAPVAIAKVPGPGAPPERPTPEPIARSPASESAPAAIAPTTAPVTPPQRSAAEAVARTSAATPDVPAEAPRAAAAPREEAVTPPPPAASAPMPAKAATAPLPAPAPAAPAMAAAPAQTAPVAAKPMSEPTPVSVRARLEADPAATVAPNAAPRGPEIRVGARLEAGDCRVDERATGSRRDKRTDEVSEESK